MSIRTIIILATVLALSACVTNPNAPPEPGSDQWYVHRIEEIEAAKTAGQLTQEQYLSLKNEADATRAARLNAVRYNNSGSFFGVDDYH